jgi:CHAD domain-containing protein/CYTH domain-containing protein
MTPAEPETTSSPPPTPLDSPAGPALAGYALRLLDSAAAARDRLAAGGDAEALHDVRVAVRRLRSLLRAHRIMLAVPAESRRQLGALAEATGEMRDLEVQLAWLREARATLGSAEKVGQSWLTARLARREGRARRRLKKRLPELFAPAEEALRKWLATRAATALPHEGEFGSAVAALLPDLVGALTLALAGIHSREDQAEAHAARIAAKRLRYALEPISEQLPEAAALATELSLLQDELGAMHDTEVLLGTIGAAIDKSGGDPRRHDPTPALVAVAAAVGASQGNHYQALEQDWLAGRARTLLDAALALAERSTAPAPANREIERKYLLRALPELPDLPGRRTLEIEQGYLPGERVQERIRRVRENGAERWYRSVKLGLGLSRLEFEDETTAEIFAALWPLTVGRRIRKRRHAVPQDGMVWEVDQFLDRELVLAEVELASADALVTVPAWLAVQVVREVTGEAGYQNSVLAG